jgi:hypothetical protein
MVLRPTQSPVQWVSADLYLGVKRPGRKAGGPLTSIYCRGQEYLELYLHSPNTPSWRGAQLKKSTGTTLPLLLTKLTL